jgi:hypothetical protein
MNNTLTTLKKNVVHSLEKCFPDCIIPTRRDEFERFKYDYICEIERYTKMKINLEFIFKTYKDDIKHKFFNNGEKILFYSNQTSDPNFNHKYKLLFYDFLDKQFIHQYRLGKKAWELYLERNYNQGKREDPTLYLFAVKFIVQKFNKKDFNILSNNKIYNHHVKPYFEVLYYELQ